MDPITVTGNDGRDYVVMSTEVFKKYEHSHKMVQSRNKKMREVMKEKYWKNKEKAEPKSTSQTTSHTV